MSNTIYPCLWFNGNAKAAADLYCSVFNNSKITLNTPMVVNFDLNGQKFMGLNGGPMFSPNPSISFFVVCETLDEIENAWKKFLDGGMVLMPLDKYAWSEKYGWIQDKFGISWQLSYGKMQEVGQKISPTLMFTNKQTGKAEQATHFYTSIVENSSIVGILKYNKNEDDVEGTVKHAQFKLNNYVIMAMDSSFPHAFGFTEGISLVISCETQKEIDYYWSKFTEDGEESMCGWLKDKYGVSWQVIPSMLGELMSNPEKSPRVMKAFLKMKKFDIEKLINA